MHTSPAARRAVACGVGAAVAGLVAALRSAELLPGPITLALAVAVGLAVPSSRLLARRILWHGAILAGVVPVLWWTDLPLGTVGRAGLLLAAALGGLTAWLGWEGIGGLAARTRRIVPDWQVVDLLPLGAALASAWFLQAWLRVSTGVEGIAALVTGWDHSAHLGMVRGLRLTGATADVVAPPAGETWQFASYPQGYHAGLATLMEALSSTAAPGRPGPPVGQEVVTYLQATSLMLLGTAVLVGAGLCALPRLRRRPAVAAPVAALAVAALVIGPGAMSFAHGFVNFVVAAALTACVPLVVVGMPRVPLPLPLAAVGGLLVAVAHSWALLLVMALPMAAVLLLPLRRSRWRADRRTWWICGAVLAATAVGMLAALRILLVHDVDAVLVLPGGVLGPEMGALALIVAGALSLPLWGATRSTVRTTWAAVGPAAGVVAAAGVALLQLRAGGELSYYFWKLIIGVELVSAVVLGIAVARATRAAPPRRPRAARARVAIASMVLAAGATQVFGAAATGRAIFPVPGVKLAQAEAVLAAVDVAATAGTPTVVLTPPVAHALNPLSAQQWHLALTGRWTAQANALAVEALVTEAGGAQDLLTAARVVLAQPGVQVIAPPEAAAALRSELPDDLAARVLTW